jgi:hypothetical protein
MSDNTFTLNDKEYSLDALTDQQKSLLAEANLAKSFLQKIEYEHAVMKGRYDLLVNTLAKELEGGQTTEA